ncbi:MAG: hypothetical protein AAF747_08920 [Planctomycetota bacterium]
MSAEKKGSSGYRKPGDMVRRFGVYFVGVAIGLVLVGLLQRARQNFAPLPPGVPGVNEQVQPEAEGSGEQPAAKREEAEDADG